MSGPTHQTEPTAQAEPTGHAGPIASPLAAAVVGTELPPLEVPVTRTLIIAGAIASRDFEPVHHDHVVAQERGSADLFMNILTTNGLIGRYVTDWTGPGARLRRIDIRLGVPAYPGDTLRLTGAVIDAVGDGDGEPLRSVNPDGPIGAASVQSSPEAGPSPAPAPAPAPEPGGGELGARRVTVAVRATNARGDHASGTVEVETRTEAAGRAQVDAGTGAAQP